MTKNNVNIDPVLMRALENWLDTMNELSYQPLFCFWLSSQGHTVHYSIQNTNFEKGKDVVSTDKNGVHHAYQLKGGNINLSRWRDEVMPEIEECIGIPIKHPNFLSSSTHRSYLVTNGKISDDVRERISEFNQGKWKKSPLKYLERGELLTGFYKILNGFIPQNIEGYRLFTELYFADPKDVIELEKLNTFYHSLHYKANNKSSVKRYLQSILLYCNIFNSKYRDAKNHISSAHLLILSLSIVIYNSEKFELEFTEVKQIYNSLFDELINSARLLDEELLNDGLKFIDTDIMNVAINPLKKELACALVFALKYHQSIMGDKSADSIVLRDTVSKYLYVPLFIGEASLYPIISLSILFYKKGFINESMELLSLALDKILVSNGRHTDIQGGLREPYFNIFEFLKISSELMETKKYSNHLSSFYLKSIVFLLEKFNMLEILGDKWVEISHFFFEEYVPDKSTDFWLWRSKAGINRTEIPPKQARLSILREQITSIETFGHSIIRHEYNGFLPFYLCLFTHRVNPMSILKLYSIPFENYENTD